MRVVDGLFRGMVMKSGLGVRRPLACAQDQRAINGLDSSPSAGDVADDA